MELLEGETLRARLEHGALPARKAVDLAVQIAEGLAAAHEKGIVHRDLKPENVFVTREGRVKLLDFGLAKKTGPATGPGSRLQTAEQHTEPGTVMGTVSYMSPEQVRGEAVDHRSDIFSFGAVLYEMLAGRQAFERDTAADSMTAILKEDPPEIADERLRPVARAAAHRAALPGEETGGAFPVGAGHRLRPAGALRVRRHERAIGRRRAQRVAPWLTVIAVAAVLGVAGLALYRKGEKAERRSAAEIRFRQMSFRPQTIFQAAFAPDGETIVYSAALEGNVPELFMIRPEYPEPRPLGLPRTHLLSISSKGELAVLTNARFIAHRLVHRHSRAGLAREHRPARDPRGCPSSRLVAGRIRAGHHSNGGRKGPAGVPDRQGALRDRGLPERPSCLAPRRPDRPLRAPHAVGRPRVGHRRGPGGKARLPVRRLCGGGGPFLVSDGRRSPLHRQHGGKRQTLYGVDLSGHRRVALPSAGGLTMHDVSRTGRWLVTRDDVVTRSPSWRPAQAPSAICPGSMLHIPFLSRDGRMLLFVDESAAAGLNYGVCLRKTDGGPVVRLGEGRPSGLSPDGKWALAIIFTPPQLVIYPTGPGETRRLPRGDLEAYQSAGWFPDGKSVLVCGNESGKASRCYAQDVSGGPPRPVTPEATTNCTVSPDGLQILYLKLGGTYFVQFAGGGTTQPAPGLTPDDQVIRWSADGRSVYVYRPTNVPFRIERLDLASGRRVLIREVAPADRTGVLWLGGRADG